MSQLWYDLREEFEFEDGSLPDFLTIHYSRLEAVSDAFEFLRSISEPISPKFELWLERIEKGIVLNEVENPALLVSNGEACPFCWMFEGALSDSKERLPALGVFVYQDCLQLYYSPGPYWSAESLQKLFEVISILSKIDGFKEIEFEYPNSEFWQLFEWYYKQFVEWRSKKASR